MHMKIKDKKDIQKVKIENEDDIILGNNNTKDQTTVQECLHSSENNLKLYKQTWIKIKDIYAKCLVSRFI